MGLLSSLGVGIDYHTKYWRVYDLVTIEGTWDWHRINSLFSRVIRDQIVAIMPPNPAASHVRLTWKWSDKDDFSSVASYK